MPGACDPYHPVRPSQISQQRAMLHVACVSWCKAASEACGAAGPALPWGCWAHSPARSLGISFPATEIQICALVQ